MEYARALLPDGEAWHSRTRNWQTIGTLVETLEAQQLPDPPPEDEWYGWEPLPLLASVSIVSPSRKSGASGRFLDVGSKLALASALGWEAHGIERHAPYARISRRLFPDCEVVDGDAREFDGYGDFDAVYCYRLAREESDQAALNAHIVEHMRPGALFWCVGPPWPEGLERVGGYIWRV